MVQCPRCGIQVMNLEEVAPEIVAVMTATGDFSTPSSLCTSCILELKNFVSSQRQGVLMAQSKAKEERRKNIWKNRVSHIKKGRKYMEEKRYSDAAVAFEKYLKVLHVIFEKQNDDDIRPDDFKVNAKTSELTALVSVYWDLIRIYDTNEKYKDRLVKVSNQLAVFLHFTPIYADIIRKAKAFQKKAKNPSVIKDFLKKASQDKSKCFIATAAFGSPDSPEVIQLRTLRDNSLATTTLGRSFIHIYYFISPSIAQFLNRNKSLKPAVRALLRFLIKCVSVR